MRAFLGLQASEALASYRELAGAMNRILKAVGQAVPQVPSERLSAQDLRRIYEFMRQVGITPIRELTAAEIAPVILGEQVF